jgi:hypothetical protein
MHACLSTRVSRVGIRVYVRVCFFVRIGTYVFVDQCILLCVFVYAR